MYQAQTLSESRRREYFPGDDIVIGNKILHYPPSTVNSSQDLSRFVYQTGSSDRDKNAVVFYGPYISVSAGLYIVTLAEQVDGLFEVYITFDFGRTYLSKQAISSKDDLIVFMTDKDVTNFEIVVRRTPQSKRLAISEVILTRTTHDDMSKAGLKIPQMHELQYFQTESEEGLSFGRNVKAGYLRGVGINPGSLVPFVLNDSDWIASMAASAGRSIANLANIMNIFMILKYSNVDGNIIEFGAYQGGLSIFMAMLLKRLGSSAKVFALDTFAGMPEDCDPDLDLHRPGGFSEAKVEEIEQIKANLQLDNLILLKGLFQDTVGLIPANERKFFLSHIDCDIYNSVKFSLDYSKKHAVTGAYIILDDPLVADCLGAFQAVEEELIQKERLYAEQAYPHLVYRYPPLTGAKKPS